MSTPNVSSSSTDLKELYKMALLTREKAYSPYSGHKVGAAIRTRDGKLFTGCNVENSSYGATICAERVAIQKAVSELGRFAIREVMVVTDATPAWPPCGMCRQVVAEFASPDTLIHSANLAGDLSTSRLSEIFPNSFTPAHLGKS
ncbi:MAG: cytidine deaminase [Bdellovibrionota bacterium]